MSERPWLTTFMALWFIALLVVAGSAIYREATFTCRDGFVPTRSVGGGLSCVQGYKP